MYLGESMNIQHLGSRLIRDVDKVDRVKVGEDFFIGL